MGLAVFDGGELVYHGVHTLDAAGSPHRRLTEARALVLRLFRDFRPGLLAIERAFFAQNRNTALLNVLVDEICAQARLHRVVVRAIAPSTVKKRVCGNGGASKAAVARAVVARHPQLRPFLGQDRKWKERYHGNMFDAVAIGMTADLITASIPRGLR